MRNSINNSKVKVIAIMLFVSLLVSIIGTSSVFAAESTISVTNVEITEKSDTIEIEKLEFDNTSIDSNIVYHKVGDYVKYKITIKNTSTQKYTIKSISDNNKNEFISYEYPDYAKTEIDADGSVDILVTIVYSKEADEQNKVQDLSVDISLTLEDESGNIVTEKVYLNPKTGDSIIVYIIMLPVSLVAITVLTIFYIKGRKKSKKLLGLLILMIVVTPAAVDAAGSTITLNFNNKIKLKDTIVYTYIDENGKESTKTVAYGGTVQVPEAITKDGYIFEGWVNESGEVVSSEIKNTTKDIKLTPKLTPEEYTITYTLNGGTAENPIKYTIESNDITLKEPTREEYTFVGWTGDNGDTAQKSVTIKKGSMGNKAYTANWTAKEYTITYNLDGGTIQGQKTTYTIETEDFTLPTPTKSGYVFKGWTGTDLENETKTVTITKGSTGNRTYTANWANMGKIVITTYLPPSDLEYTYFGNNSSAWKSTDDIREGYSWQYELPCLEFEDAVTRVRLGYSQTEFVTYNNQTYADGFVSKDKKKMWFSNSIGGYQDGYYTVGITQNGVDHELRVLIESNVITSMEVVY